jgi:hypothetical protein
MISDYLEKREALYSALSSHLVRGRILDHFIIPPALKINLEMNDDGTVKAVDLRRDFNLQGPAYHPPTDLYRFNLNGSFKNPTDAL